MGGRRTLCSTKSNRFWRIENEIHSGLYSRAGERAVHLVWRGGVCWRGSRRPGPPYGSRRGCAGWHCGRSHTGQEMTGFVLDTELRILGCENDDLAKINARLPDLQNLVAVFQ